MFEQNIVHIYAIFLLQSSSRSPDSKWGLNRFYFEEVLNRFCSSTKEYCENEKEAKLILSLNMKKQL